MWFSVCSTNYIDIGPLCMHAFILAYLSSTGRACLSLWLSVLLQASLARQLKADILLEQCSQVFIHFHFL